MSRSFMLDSTRRILAIAADAAPVEERAEAVIEELVNVIPYDAAQISLWEPHLSEHRTVASRGYTAAMREALNGSGYRNDRVWEVLEKRGAHPVFWSDCPFDRRESAFFVENIEAHGFREGATILLRSVRDEYMGMVTLNLESASAPGDSVRELVGMASSGLIPLVDRLAPARQFVMMSPGAGAGAALDPVNGWVPLSGEGLPPRCLLDLVDELLINENRPMKLHWHDPNPPSGRRQPRPEPLRVEVFPFTHPSCLAVIRWTPQRLPYGLTRREVEVLELLATGASNTEIAKILFLSTRTVSTHVERILGKMSAPTRAVAALLAERDGLVFGGQRYVN